MKKVLVFIISAIIMCSFMVTAFADAMSWNVEPAQYTVYVLTPDGGLNLRNGPGTEFETVTNQRIPDYTELFIDYTYNGWGYTNYNDEHGWVYLGQTTREKPQEPIPETTTAETTEKSTSVSQTVTDKQTTTVFQTVPDEKTTVQITNEETETVTDITSTEDVSEIVQIRDKNNETHRTLSLPVVIMLFVAVIILVSTGAALIILISKKNHR